MFLTLCSSTLGDAKGRWVACVRVMVEWSQAAQEGKLWKCHSYDVWFGLKPQYVL